MQTSWLGFFGKHFRLSGRREEKVLDLIADHLSRVQSCVRELKRMLVSVEQKNWTLVNSQAKIIAKYESMADDIHREAVIQIAQGAFFAGTREDFLDLMEKVDDIADAARDAARTIVEAPIDPKILEITGKSGFTLSQFAEGVDAAVTLLAETITSLKTDAQTAVTKALEVEQAEENADSIKDEMMQQLSTHRHDIPVLAYIQAKDMIFKLDKVADAAEDCSDLVITIVAKAVS